MEFQSFQKIWWNPCNLYITPPFLRSDSPVFGAYFATASLCSSGVIFTGIKNNTSGPTHHRKCPCLNFSRTCRCYLCLELFQLIQKGPKAIHVHISAYNYTKHYPLFSINHAVQVFHVHISTCNYTNHHPLFLPNMVQVPSNVTLYRMSPLHQRVYQALPQTEWSVTHLFCSSKLLTCIDKLLLSSVEAFTLSSSPSM